MKVLPVCLLAMWIVRQISVNYALSFVYSLADYQLTLCIMKAYSISNIKNANDVVSEIANFFNYSPPNHQHFIDYVIESVSFTEIRVKHKDLCGNMLGLEDRFLFVFLRLVSCHYHEYRID